MENQLEVIVKESKLPEPKAAIILKQFQDYFKIAAEWEARAKTIVVTDASQKELMKIARTGRIFIRDKITDVEKARVALKAEVVREGKTIDGISNVLKGLMIPIKEYLDKQEKFVEIRAKEKADTERAEAERVAEELRVENELLDKLAEDRYNEAVFYKQFWTPGGTYAFREMSQTNFDSIMEDLSTRKKEYEAEQERIRLENERLKKEAEAKQKEHDAEIKKAEDERKAAEEKARAVKLAAEEKARKEKERQSKVLADQKAKAEAEKKKIEDKAKAEKEKQAKIIADQKAEAARKEKERLDELAKLVECPNCHHKFNPQEK